MFEDKCYIFVDVNGFDTRESKIAADQWSWDCGFSLEMISTMIFIWKLNEQVLPVWNKRFKEQSMTGMNKNRI